MLLASKIEAILFLKGEPVSKSFLSKTLEVSQSEISEGLESLKQSLSDRGIVLVEKENQVMLGISPELSDLAESIQKEDVEKELTKAALETLSIILYKGPISRSEIDFIRGVNSTFIIRNLLVRGLVERKPDPENKRSYVYEPSMELLTHLGVTNINELPNRESVISKIEEFASGEEAEAENNQDD